MDAYVIVKGTTSSVNSRLVFDGEQKQKSPWEASATTTQLDDFFAVKSPVMTASNLMNSGPLHVALSPKD